MSSQDQDTLQRGPAVYTVGHSNRSGDEFIQLLARCGVHTIVDVRRFAGSRRNPQFGRDALPRTLERHAIAYHALEALGGRRSSDSAHGDDVGGGWRNTSFRAYAIHTQSSEYRGAIDELRAIAATARTAIMCSEAVPWRCHRWLISDTLLARSTPVAHILSATKLHEHQITPFARVDGERVTWPGPPSAQTLKLGPAIPFPNLAP